MTNQHCKVGDSFFYKDAYGTLHQLNALLIALQHSAQEMDQLDVLAAMAGVQNLAGIVSQSLEKLSNVEVLNG